MKVLVLNQCATNIGDRAVLYFVLRELAANGVKDITVSTTNPYYWKSFPGFAGVDIKFVPFGWDLSFGNGPSKGLFWKIAVRLRSIVYKRLLFPVIRKKLIESEKLGFARYLCNSKFRKAVERTDVTIGTGGHRITTLLSKEGVFSATYDMAYALLQNKPLYLWSQTIGPFKFENSANERLFQKLLERCETIYIRDENSRQAINQLKVSTENVKDTIESVFGLYEPSEAKVIRQENKIFGISIYVSQRRTPQEHSKYVRDLTDVVDHAIEKGYRVKFFPMEMEDGDKACMHDIINQCKNGDACSIVEGYPETIEHMKGVSECDIFMGHKTHSVVFALVVGTPLIAISYHKKTTDFMEQFSLGDFVIDDTYMNGTKLIELFNSIEVRHQEIQKKEHEFARLKSDKVKSDFAEMLSVISQ